MNPELLNQNLDSWPAESGEESIKEREEYWKEDENVLGDSRDALGMPIDNGIIKTVVALNVMGLSSDGSCEGHLDRGYPYPWVDIQNLNEPKRFKGESEGEMEERIAKKYGIDVDNIYTDVGEKCGARQEVHDWWNKKEETDEYKEWREENKKLQDSAEELLAEFYSGREVPDNLVIKIHKIGVGGAFRLQNGSNIFTKKMGKVEVSRGADELTGEEQKLAEKNLPGLRAEMNNFSEFLRNKFLTGKNI